MLFNMKTRMLALLGLLCFGISPAIKAQHTINGTVTDGEGMPLTGATVSLVETYKGTFSGKDGTYRLSDLPKGTYLIRASFIGFTPGETEVQINNADVLNIDFQLLSSAFKTEEVVISSTRAGDKTPTTYTNLSKEDVEQANFAQDLPFIMEFTPSAVVTSDAGTGVGYTGIRIRGSDPTRTNVTINGIPINDAESHGVFWVNMPDFASSVDNIQIQRGVGTSTNGAAAFGASINVQTDRLIKDAYAEYSAAAGSFNTLRNTLKAGTGLINEKFTLDTRLSKVTSDGYVDRGAADLRSFYISGAYFGKKDILRFNAFSGQEITYQSWNGVSEEQLRTDRTFNSAGAYEDENGVTRFYDNEVDNYQQDHYQLHYTRELSPLLTFNTSVHYTRGRGYFEQYRNNDRYATYGLEPVLYGGTDVTFSTDSLLTDDGVIYNGNPGSDTTVTLGAQMIDRTDLVRRRWLDNHFYGLVGSLNYNNRKGLDVTAGWGWNTYDGDHFGEVIWANEAPESMIRDRYYDNSARKTEYHFYGKATYQVSDKVNIFVDLQYRGIGYDFEGLNVVNEVQLLTNQNVRFNFFNPKAGVYYDLNNQSALYASYSVGNREPVRRDFTESTPQSRPVHETLHNIEMGYKLRQKRFFLNANYYLMDYVNQLVLTGQINDVGGFTRTNIDNSYRTGIELEGGYRISKYLKAGGNLTLSQNKIASFSEFIDNFDTGDQLEILHQNTDIAFSPNIIGALDITVSPLEGLDISLIQKYVGDQFLDNTSNTERMLDAYFVSNVRINYTLRFKPFREVTFGLLLYNVLDNAFESNGYTFSYIAGDQMATENYYYPQAGRNILLNATFAF
jgi:iron complex outermembrane receptor protein